MVVDSVAAFKRKLGKLGCLVFQVNWSRLYKHKQCLFLDHLKPLQCYVMLRKNSDEDDNHNLASAAICDSNDDDEDDDIRMMIGMMTSDVPLPLC